MVDANIDQTSSTSNGKPPVIGGLLALILATTAVVAPLTTQSEGTVYKAYLDPVGIPTICNGHTAGVKLGDVATQAQCDAYRVTDIQQHIGASLKSTPSLSKNTNALAAAGDFSYNAGDGVFLGSPMRRHFLDKDWVGGCLAFLGYWDSGTYSKPQAHYACVPKKDTRGKIISGKWLCKLPGLVTRRLHEKQLCLTGKWG